MRSGSVGGGSNIRSAPYSVGASGRGGRGGYVSGGRGGGGSAW
jgi:hypothetical protein